MNKMQTANYDRELGSAIANIGIKCNFQNHLNPSGKKAFIVEGMTDKRFLGRITKPIVLSFSIGELSRARATMLNCNSQKGIILDIFKRLSNNPDFFGFPKGCGQWDIFGLVDRDYDDETLNFRLPRLFVTDTHDIETLILSTDERILSRINGLHISEEATRLSLYLAGQLAYYRQALYKLSGKKQEIDIRNITSSNGTIDFSAFVENDNIVPKKLIKLLYENQGNRLSNEKLNGLVRSLLSDRQLKKHLDRNGEWKHQKDSFSPDQIEDFWMLVRGHDILSAICFYDPNANTLFQDSGAYSINREFEKTLIDEYDISKFTSTDLYQKMKSEDLVNV